ncbi:transglycosylase [Maribellus comscasis]|uniref:Transglycosylase n=1 Tax=Maribellus comscasis TaxID=2681766 RepID=A0A6I6JYM0_9BACT|nr:transglycosylase [Maribellus comscasis]QGY47661.1 transglycosylase [Maribellus comscasis]
MKTLGILLFIIGVVGTILFGIQAANNSETFSFLGLDIAISDANWTPVIVSAVLAVIGVVVLLIKPKK